MKPRARYATPAWGRAGMFPPGPASPIRYALTLVDDRPLLPEQFHPAPSRGSGEVRLWLAVIEQACREADHRHDDYRQPARRFLRSAEFAAICELVGIEPTFVRNRTIRWRSRQRLIAPA